MRFLHAPLAALILLVASLAGPALAQPVTNPALPPDAAKASNQAAVLGRLGEVQASPTANTLLDRLKTIHADVAALQAQLASTLPLPNGAATAGNQATANTALSAIQTSSAATAAAVAAPLPAGSNKIGAVDLGSTDSGKLDAIAANAVSTGPKAWVHPVLCTNGAGAAATCLAAGLAQTGLILENEDATNPVRCSLDTTTATSTHGISIAAGQVLVLGWGQVPTAAVTCYGAAAVTVSIAYQP